VFLSSGEERGLEREGVRGRKKPAATVVSRDRRREEWRARVYVGRPSGSRG
jgi:hypothetical protein